MEYKIYNIKGREIKKCRGMLFTEWCKINHFEYMIDELDWNYVESEYGLDENTLTQGFDKPCKWYCHVCGAEMNFKVLHRTNGHWDCSYCNGKRLDLRYHSVAHDLKDILDEWDYDLNEESPEEVSSSSVHKYHWICPVGHLYESSPYHRKEGKGCSICKNLRIEAGINDVETTEPELMKEWDFDKNTILPTQITRGNDKYKIWWICNRGHSYQATCNARTANKTGCPYCANIHGSSFPEAAIFYYLSQCFTNIYRRVKISKHEFDIYMPDEKILIEFNGKNWHNKEYTIIRDKEKRQISKDMGYTLICVNAIRGRGSSTEPFSVREVGNIIELTGYCEKSKPSSVDNMIIKLFDVLESKLGKLPNYYKGNIDTQEDFYYIDDMITSQEGYLLKE